MEDIIEKAAAIALSIFFIGAVAGVVSAPFAMYAGHMEDKRHCLAQGYLAVNVRGIMRCYDTATREYVPPLLPEEVQGVQAPSMK